MKLLRLWRIPRPKLAKENDPVASIQEHLRGTNLEQEVSVAIAPAHEEALQAVRKADVKFADETSWKLWGKLCWLWAAANANIAVFVIHAKRGAAGLAALLGEEIHGILHSDRWHVYLQVPEERRQLCWAHLKCDFQKVVDLGAQASLWAVAASASLQPSFVTDEALADPKEKKFGVNAVAEDPFNRDANPLD